MTSQTTFKLRRSHKVVLVTLFNIIYDLRKRESKGTEHTVKSTLHAIGTPLHFIRVLQGARYLRPAWLPTGQCSNEDTGQRNLLSFGRNFTLRSLCGY